MKALCVFSGGLDSMLAAELIRAQGIDVLALFFQTPFFGSKTAKKSALSTDLPFRVVDITDRHLKVVKAPRHGYGGNMNPCIDCHALMFRIAGEMLEEEQAGFVLTGEVLGQRPMSQNKQSLDLVARESGLDGLLLRPLTAKCLQETIPEQKGWVKRDLLMDFQGRTRKPQIDLARKLNIEGYPAPAGGCILTEKAFSRRLKDLFSHNTNAGPREIELLKLGRHFRISPDLKLVAGRNKRENQAIQDLSGDKDLILTTISVPGPTVLVSGDVSEETLQLSAGITLAYSDATNDRTTDVMVKGRMGEEIISATVRDKKEFRGYLI